MSMAKRRLACLEKRITMSAYLFSCVTLFGREQNKEYHVLQLPIKGMRKI